MLTEHLNATLTSVKEKNKRRKGKKQISLFNISRSGQVYQGRSGWLLFHG